jgi:hypothetical protein
LCCAPLNATITQLNYGHFKPKCQGDGKLKSYCFEKPCDIQGGWSEWSDWDDECETECSYGKICKSSLKR